MKATSLNIIILLIITAAIPLWVSGQYTGASVRIDSTSILIGNQARVELRVTVPAGHFVQWPLLTDTLARNIEILRKTPIDTVSSDSESYTLKQDLFITSFDSGYHVVRPIVFQYGLKGDTLGFFTETLQVGLDVRTIQTDPNQDIKPIKPPLRAPVTFAEIAPWLGIGLLIAALAVLAYYFFFRKKAAAPPPTTRLKPTIPPYEAAIEALENLRLKKLWQSGRVKEYYTEMTDIVREYIELRFNVRALEMTTGEIASAINQTSVNGQAREKLLQALILADLVKFAKEQPQPLENDLCLNHCFDFVRETRPQREEELQKPAVAAGDKSEKV